MRAVSSITPSSDKRNIIISIVIILILIANIPNTILNVNADEWSMLQNNATHTGYTSSNSPSTNQLAWYKSIYGSSSPIISEGKLYVCGSEIYCLNQNDGNVIWSQEIYWTQLGTVCLAINENNLFVGSSYETSHRVHIKAFNKDTGDEIWEYKTSQFTRLLSSLTFGAEKVFFTFSSWGAENEKLVALSMNNGSEVWTKDIQNAFGTVAVVENTVYFSDDDGFVYALNAMNGEEIWTSYVVEPSGHSSSLSSPTIHNNKVFVSCWKRNVHALNRFTGEPVWTSEGGGAYSSIAAFDDKVVAAGKYGGVVAINEGSGVKIWGKRIPTYEAEGIDIGIKSSPAIANRLVYVGSDTRIYALNFSNGDIIWSYNTGGKVWSSPAIADGMVFVTSPSGIFAFSDVWPGREPDIFLSSITVLGSYMPQYPEHNTCYITKDNNNVIINVAIRNNGEVPGQIERATIKIYDGLPKDDGILLKESIISIDHEGLNTVSIQWNASIGSHTIYTIVNSETQIESNISNNYLEKVINIKVDKNSIGISEPSFYVDLSVLIILMGLMSIVSIVIYLKKRNSFPPTKN